MSPEQLNAILRAFDALACAARWEVKRGRMGIARNLARDARQLVAAFPGLNFRLL